MLRVSDCGMLSALSRTSRSHLQCPRDVIEEVGRKKESEDEGCYKTLSSIRDVTGALKNSQQPRLTAEEWGLPTLHP